MCKLCIRRVVWPEHEVGVSPAAPCWDSPPECLPQEPPRLAAPSLVPETPSGAAPEGGGFQAPLCATRGEGLRTPCLAGQDPWLPRGPVLRAGCTLEPDAPCPERSGVRGAAKNQNCSHTLSREAQPGLSAGCPGSSSFHAGVLGPKSPVAWPGGGGGHLWRGRGRTFQGVSISQRHPAIRTGSNYLGHQFNGKFKNNESSVRLEDILQRFLRVKQDIRN